MEAQSCQHGIKRDKMSCSICEANERYHLVYLTKKRAEMRKAYADAAPHTVPPDASDDTAGVHRAVSASKTDNYEYDSTDDLRPLEADNVIKSIMCVCVTIIVSVVILFVWTAYLESRLPPVEHKESTNADN